MTKKYIVDTNLLLDMPHIVKEHECVILSHVIRELEKHKLSSNGELAYKARVATRVLDEISEDITFDIKDYKVKFSSDYDEDYTDNKIIEACIENGYGIITNDLLLRLKAKEFDIGVLEINDGADDYSGYKEVNLSDEELASFYENLTKNTYNLLINQYLIINDINNETVGISKWTGNEMKTVHQKGFSTNMFGKFKPFDVYQSCAIDSLASNKLTMIKGKAGSGKSLIALNYIWSQIERGKLDKLIIFSNPTASRNSSRLGFYPGTRTEKLLDSAVGSMLGSKFGDIGQVEMLINNGKILLLPFADIRGFDSTGMRAAIWFVESQNLDVELMKLGIQRIGDDCIGVIDGDYESQVDMSAYEGSKNGMRRASEVYRGRGFYGEAMLPIIYRSEMAGVADLM